MKAIGVLCSVLFLFGTALAQQSDLLERVYSGSSKETNPQAVKREIQEQAFQKISEDVIKELIGEERFAKNKTLINNKIIKNSGRYIPFVKPSAVTQEGEESKMSVSLKVSLKDLKQLLQNNSLLADNDTLPIVLPMVSWQDRVQGRSYRWWQSLNKEPQGFLMAEGKIFEESLREAFQKNNFFLIKPIESGLGSQVPVDFQNEKISSEDSQFFAKMFNAPVIIDGQVVLSKADKGNGYRIEVKMTAVQVSNGRAIADVSRRFETSNGVFENVVDKKIKEISDAAANDLSVQVLDAWQRGSVGSNILRITIKGRNTLTDVESLKESVRTQITQVKNIRERLVTSDSISFEVDTTVSSEELAGRLESLQVANKKLGRVSADSDEIVMKWNQ
ncbi:hypothetical protein [Bdellovibrio sp. HCB2-146]|uniref:hypothetical protein n=1 Tax=Bdellovibrio sp. HCB2-146 TaxID=3394362 RepID=UPI0039BCA7AC